MLNPNRRTRRQPEDNKTHEKAEASREKQEQDLNAVKGGKEGDGGQRKGYGQCWEWGEMGHPRRECLVFLKCMGKELQQDNTVASLKGTGKYGKRWKME